MAGHRGEAGTILVLAVSLMWAAGFAGPPTDAAVELPPSRSVPRTPPERSVDPLPDPSPTPTRQPAPPTSPRATPGPRVGPAPDATPAPTTSSPVATPPAATETAPAPAPSPSPTVSRDRSDVATPSPAPTMSRDGTDVATPSPAEPTPTPSDVTVLEGNGEPVLGPVEGDEGPPRPGPVEDDGQRPAADDGRVARPPTLPSSRPTDPAPAAFAATAGRILVDHADTAAFPVALLLLVLAFLVIQDQVDRRDPKLAHAPPAELELEFPARPGLVPWGSPGSEVAEADCRRPT